MKTEFKKIGTRKFYRLHNGVMTYVLNTENTSSVVVTSNELSMEDIFEDPAINVKESIESEFKAAHEIAIDRILTQKL